MADAKSGPIALVELTKARLREFFREKGVIFWVFLFPLLMAFGLGIAFRSKPADLARVAVVGEANHTVVVALLQSKRVLASRESAAEASRELAKAKVDLIVQCEPGGVSYVYDKTQEKSAWARTVTDRVIQVAAGQTDPVATQDRFVSELGARYIDFLIPGLVAMNLMGTSMWGVGYNLVLARKRKLLRRYAVTPMRRSHFLLSYFFSRSLFLVLEVGVLVVFGRLLFGTVVQGNYLALAIVAALGAASFAGISLIVGARVDNTESANGWMNLVQMPMWVLSGTFFSYERFPDYLHTPIRCLPLTALTDGLRAIFNQGVGLGQLHFELTVMAVWGLTGFAIALRWFRWQ
jgi:ABC-type multidrug transport system permease subunit